MALELTTDNFEQTINQGVTLVDFWAPWCGPCRMMTPIVEEIAKEKTDIKVAKVNIDEHPTIAQKYNILSIPTLIYFKDGEPAQQSVGVVSKKAILDKLASL
ncbi:MAG: thioredoxin [Candidatus Cloacimonadales bacterium]|jgi:thioredoxin 1|nr:thioredoxin [Candidatus Cloacimonadota bacterium]MDX9978383.1 thioredoxin [Candidatus Cloacimonadales bacterium]